MILGVVKVIAVLVIDFMAVYTVCGAPTVAGVITALIGTYTFFGGYIDLLRDGAVGIRKLSSSEANRLKISRDQLIQDVNGISNMGVSGLRLYLIPGDNTMNGTAYGCGCVSVTQGLLNNADPMMLSSVLGHEVSHLLCLDAEFRRAVFISITVFLIILSFISAVATVVIFIVFLIAGCFGSWLGLAAFDITTNLFQSIIRFIQQMIVTIYQIVLGIVARNEEYRADSYACKLGYGIHLIHYLMLVERSESKMLTLRDVLYRSHPPCSKRIAHLEKQMNNGAALIRKP